MWAALQNWFDYSPSADWVMAPIVIVAVGASLLVISRMIGSSPLLIGVVAAGLAALGFGLTWASPIIGILAFIAAHQAKSSRQ
jgi:hypothetical protein